MRIPAFLAFLLLAGGPAFAQDSLIEARRAGTVGERFDGYLGFAATPSATVRKQASAVNIKRRSLYTGLATRRNVTAAVAGLAAGCELLSRVAVGETYMLSDGVWRRRQAGDPAPVPEHCQGR